jgi:hypothetical protein
MAERRSKWQCATRSRNEMQDVASNCVVERGNTGVGARLHHVGLAGMGRVLFVNPERLLRAEQNGVAKHSYAWNGSESSRAAKRHGVGVHQLHHVGLLVMRPDL